MTALFLIGRIIFGGYFIYSAYSHFAKNKLMAGYAASKRVPFPVFSVLLSGLFILFGGLGVLFWIYVRLALMLIAIFLILVTPSMHNFWADKDAGIRANNKIQFGKNMAMLGATLMLMALA